jgi:hypothetical protein
MSSSLHGYILVHFSILLLMDVLVWSYFEQSSMTTCVQVPVDMFLFFLGKHGAHQANWLGSGQNSKWPCDLHPHAFLSSVGRTQDLFLINRLGKDGEFHAHDYATLLLADWGETLLLSLEDKAACCEGS